MNLPLVVDRDVLRFGEHLTLYFCRTLRIPDDGRSYPLPPNLGAFPVRRVDDYASRVPSAWREHGGVFLPMYQREAMWIAFGGPHWYPHAVKVGIGKVCALTGAPWSDALHADPQDYVVTPPQPWLDGIASGHGTIRQFVAMPLGMGYTVEAQITGEERFGGLQLKVFAPKPGRFNRPPVHLSSRSRGFGGAPGAAGSAMPVERGMVEDCDSLGLAAGGTMEQSIYPDPHGIDTWDTQQCSRVFVHLVNSTAWREITGEEPPSTPVTAKEYARHGLPWFDLYDEALATLAPQPALVGVKSVREIDANKSKRPLQDDSSVATPNVQKVPVPLPGGVRDGKW